MKDYLRMLMPPKFENDVHELAHGELPAHIRDLIVLETRFDIILPTLVTKADLIE